MLLHQEQKSAPVQKGEKSTTSSEETTKTQAKATTQIKDSPKKCGGKVKQSVKLTEKTESDSQVQKKAERLMAKVKPVKSEMAPVKEEMFSDKTKLPEGEAEETQANGNEGGCHDLCSC